MKKTIVALILLSMLSLGMVSAAPLDVYLKVTLINQEPDPVEPGGWVDLRFKFENIGRQGSEQVIVELLPEFPFKLPPGESAIQEIGSFQAQQEGEDAIIVKYRLLVDEQAPEGENEIKLRFKEGITWQELDEFFVDVRAFDAFVSVDKVDVDPELIVPGQTSDVRITLKNDADSTLKTIKAKLDLDGIPLAPIGSSNEKVVDQITPGKSKTLRFSLAAEPEADSKLYKVPLDLEFKDELGRNFTVNNVIGLTLGDEPDLSVLIESSEIYKKGQSGQVSLKLVNKGVSDIRLVNLYIQESDDYKIVSPSEIYVGNIDSDDFENAEVDLYVTEGGEAITIPVKVEYLSANNEAYATMFELDLPLYSEKEAKKVGIVEGNGNGGIIFIIIVIIAAGIFYWRWKKKKNKKKHA